MVKLDARPRLEAIFHSALIANLSGIPEENFVPLIPQWEPPSGEIEACLFALQAAAGGFLVGGVFGYWLGQNKKA